MHYPPTPGSKFLAADGNQYLLGKEIGSGGFNFCHVCERESDSKTFVFKIANLDQLNRSATQLAERSGDVFKSYLAEINVQHRLESELVAKSITTGIGEFVLGPDSVKLPLVFTISEFVDGLTLDKWLEREFPAEDGFAGVTEEYAFFDLIERIFSAIAVLHEERIVHGDIWPRNLVVRNDRTVVVIDLGEAFLEEQLFEKVGDTKEPHHYLAPERCEFTDHLYWRTPADIFSLGCTMFYIATGHEPPSVFTKERKLKRNQTLKRDILQQLRSRNPSLYWANPGIVDLIMLCMRPRVNGARGRAETIDVLRQHIRLIQESRRGPRQEPRRRNEDPQDVLEALQNLAALDSFFGHMISIPINKAIGLYKQANSRVLSFDGRRDVLVEALIHAINYAGSGERIVAVTSTLFWHQNNFGPFGRVVTALQMAAMRGVRIEWVIVVPRGSKQADKDVVASHRKVANLLDEKGYGENYNFFTYTEVDNEIELLRQTRRSFLLIEKEQEAVLVAPDYAAEGGVISALRLWREPRRKGEFCEFFEQVQEKAVDARKRRPREKPAALNVAK